MNKLFLIDAYALIYRSYYAFIKNPRINSKGLNTSAVMGFVNTVNEVMTKEKPTHIGVAFDPAGPTFRHEAYPEYKAQREACPEDIKKSVPIIKDILKAMRIPILEMPGYEADDVIGTLATKAGQAGVATYMLTPDKDYGQLVSSNVFMYRPRYGDAGYEVLGEKEVEAKYGIPTPLQVIDLLGLMGDSSDNIPGCPGVGEKTAVKLISEFGSIEQLLAGTDRLKGALKKKIEDNRRQIKFSKFLATIKTDVPVELNLDALLVSEPDEEKLKKIFDELEFKSFADRILKKTENKSKTQNQQLDLFAEIPNNGSETSEFSNFESLKTTSHEYKLVDNEDDLLNLFDFLRTNKILSLDTETTSTVAIDAELVGLSFSVEEKKAFYVPIPAEREEAKRIVNIFKPIYEDPEILKVGQNIKYDLEVLANYGVHLAGPMFDTMIAHYLIQPELRHNMDYMAEIYLHYRTIHIDELIGPKGKGQKSMRDLAPADVYEYAAEDADITLRLKNVLEPELKKYGADRLFYEIEMPLMPVLAEMEMQGVRIDTAALAEYAVELNRKLAELEAEVRAEAGEPTLNINSTRQLGEVLFSKMRIAEKPKMTRTKQFCTDEEYLQSFAHKYRIVDRILEYRGVKKLLSTYVEALPQLVNRTTGRIHTSFNQAVTATGRLSSTNPNLQNIPVRDDLGRRIREAFIPSDDDHLLLSADYSQVELRLMAHLSEDESLIAAFEHGEDIHAATAARLFGKSLDEVTHEERRRAKTANFGIIYGISAFGLSQRLEIPRKEAREIIDGYFSSYPNVHAYMERVAEQARTDGYVATIFGRRRYLNDIKSQNAVARGLAERNAVNAPIQGSAADIMKIAMIAVHRRFAAEGIRSRVILQVHDELVVDMLRSEQEQVIRIVTESMEQAASLRVRLLVDYGIGKNWLEAH